MGNTSSLCHARSHNFHIASHHEALNEYLLGQLLGISVVFPALWLPAAAYGKGSGAVRPARAYASIALAAPFLSLSVAGALRPNSPTRRPA